MNGEVLHITQIVICFYVEVRHFTVVFKEWCLTPVPLKFRLQHTLGLKRRVTFINEIELFGTKVTRFICFGKHTLLHRSVQATDQYTRWVWYNVTDSCSGLLRFTSIQIVPIHDYRP